MKHTPQKLGSYIVHPTGRVESTSGWRGKGARDLDQHLDQDGYLCVRLVVKGKRKRWRVHRLVAELFMEPKPSFDHMLRHLDGNKTNNDVSNLRWGTAKENADDRGIHGHTSRGKKHRNFVKEGIELANANARLIAAAPEMLEVLKVISENIRHGSCHELKNGERHCLLCLTKQAIAKAEGTTPDAQEK